MRDAEKTIGNLIDKQGVAFIASVSEDGFPNMKAMLPPRRREGDTLYYPKGASDPDYCVLRFTARSGRYYANFKSESFEVP